MHERNSSLQSKTSMLKIKVSNIHAESVVVASWRSPRLFVRIEANDDVESTSIAIANSGSVSWGDEFHFDIASRSIIRFTLIATHRVRPETSLGWVEERMEEQDVSSDTVVKRRLREAGTAPVTISFRCQLLPSNAPSVPHRQSNKFGSIGVSTGIQAAMAMALSPVHIPGAALNAKNAAYASPELAEDVFKLGHIDDMSEAFSFLLQHVDKFTNLITRFSEIHPYAKFAVGVLTMAQKVVIAQKDRDDRFRQLIKITSEVYQFLNSLKMSALEGHRGTIKLLTLQTTECAYFIRDYTKQKSFVGRTAATILTGSAITGKIAEYEKKFTELKTSFLHGSALNTEIAVMRIAEQVDRIAIAGDLDDLPYASARFDLGKQCLEGTREEVFEKIYSWVNNTADDTPRVLLLNGAEGTGKSAIAHTVSRRFNELRRLGSSFFFLRDKPERRADWLFTTITRDLADLDTEWTMSLKQVISGRRAVRRTSSIQEQYEEFILKPAQGPGTLYFGPVVIVIDALDAIEDAAARRTVLALLSSRIVELPRNFRFLVTARATEEIREAFEGKPAIAWSAMDTLIDEKSNAEDMEDFFENELSAVAGLKWNDRMCKKLLKKSEGDFAWAAFAATFIKNTSARIKSPADRMRRLLSKPKSSNTLALEAADESGSESEGFFSEKIRDTLQSIPHILAGHSVMDHIYQGYAPPPPPPPQYSEASKAYPEFPIPMPHKLSPLSNVDGSFESLHAIHPEYFSH
ncbi:WD40 repeat-like protein [Favolaschia claudopus]|uniref:WD40 repeat-like protein n=1 Tax=Favolaschia claudopus TaxID=2862362 RepID=A0AAV9ZBV4_9AGAR